MDPELAASVPMLPDLDPADPIGSRKRLAAIAESGLRRSSLSGVQVATMPVRGARYAGLTCQVYTPRRPVGLLPAILWFHGGGFTSGSAALDDDDCINICETVGAVVAAADYRLAPEHPYPAALEDCFDLFSWLIEESDTLGVDRRRIAVAGTSAGAGLAAGVALLARDRGGPALHYQQLINPVLDDRMRTASMRTFTDTPVFNRTSAEVMWHHYLGAAGREADQYAAPARARNLQGLPATFIEVSALDPLRDEGLAYAYRLLNAGVSVELHAFPGTFHGSDAIRTAAVTQRAFHERMVALQVALE